MPSFTTLRHEAQRAAETASDPQLARLAKIVEELCKDCEDVELKVDKAQRDARHAKQA